MGGEMTIYAQWDKQLRALQTAYTQVCGTVTYVKNPVATQQEVIDLQEKLGPAVPADLQQAFLNFSKDVSFYAFLPDGFILPYALREVFSAQFVISIDEVLNAEDCRKNWIEGCFPNPDDPYDVVWHNKLGLMTVGNGDVIAFDLSAEKRGHVVYLSHDDGEGHGYTLGKNFEDYFSKLLSVGACGNEDWQMMPFIDDRDIGIDPDCENARIYRQLIGLECA